MPLAKNTLASNWTRTACSMHWSLHASYVIFCSVFYGASETYFFILPTVTRFTYQASSETRMLHINLMYTEWKTFASFLNKLTTFKDDKKHSSIKSSVCMNIPMSFNIDVIWLSSTTSTPVRLSLSITSLQHYTPCWNRLIILQLYYHALYF